MQANPADVYMDVITGLVAPCTAEEHHRAETPSEEGPALDGSGHWEGAAALPALWEARRAAGVSQDGFAASLDAVESMAQQVIAMLAWAVSESWISCQRFQKVLHASVCTQVCDRTSTSNIEP